MLLRSHDVVPCGISSSPVALEHGDVDELVPDAAEHVLHFRCPRQCFVFFSPGQVSCSCGRVGDKFFEAIHALIWHSCSRKAHPAYPLGEVASECNATLQTQSVIERTNVTLAPVLEIDRQVPTARKARRVIAFCHVATIEVQCKCSVWLGDGFLL